MPVLYNTEGSSLPSLSILDAVNMIRANGEERIAGVLESIQNGVNSLADALAQAAEGRFDQLLLTDSQTGELIARMGSFDELSGIATVRLWVGGNVNDPINTAPFYTDNNGKVWFLLGDSDDAAAFQILDGDGNVVVEAGSFDGYYGIAAENIWIGPGADPATAPFWSDGTGTYIGQNGAIFIRDLRGDDKGFLGVLTESPKAIASASNNGAGLIRLQVNAHGYESGDTVDAIIPGVTAPACWPITVVDANHFDLLGSTFGGAYSGSGTVRRYYGGAWVETFAAGNNGFGDALLRVFADSSMRIGAADGPRLEVDSDGNLSITDAELTIEGTYGGNDYRLTANASDLLIEALTAQVSMRLTSAAIDITDDTSPADNLSTFALGRSIVQWGDAHIEQLVDASNASLSITDPTGLEVFLFDSAAGMKMSGATVIDSLRNASFTTLSLLADLAIVHGGTGGSTASDARTNLDVYSKAEVDSAIAAAIAGIDLSSYATISYVDGGLAGKASLIHSHSGSFSGLTGVTSAHQHSYGATVFVS